MRLVVDTGVLVGDLLRVKGRRRLSDHPIPHSTCSYPSTPWPRCMWNCPAVACALALDAAVWTNDNDFLGAGVPTWTTQTLQTWLDRTEQVTTP